MEDVERIKQPCPWDKANLFASWTFPLFKKGYSRDLQIDDLYKCSWKDEASRNYERLSRQWEKEMKKKKPNLARALLKAFGFRYFAYSTLVLGYEDFFIRIIQPFFLGRIINYFWKRNDPEASEHVAYYAIGFCLCSISFVITHHPWFSNAARYGMKARVAVQRLMLEKVFCLSKLAVQNNEIGQIVNLMSNDVQRFDECSWFLPYLIIAPIQTLIISYIIWTYIGISYLSGFAIIVLFVPFQVVMGRLFGQTRRGTAEFTDERIRLMTEVLTGIKVIKMYSWEKPFSDMIQKLRKKEVGKIKLFCFLRAINLAFGFVTTRIIVFACFVTHLLLGHQLTAEMVFVTLALFNTLRITLTLQFPQAISTLAEAMVSCRRITALLTLEERNRHESGQIPGKGEPKFVRAEKLTSYWDPTDDEACLENISFEIKAGELAVIIGPTGSGKTSLLLAILKEIHNKTGKITLNGTISYASQDIWTFNSSIRDNILFGQPMNEERYKKVLTASTLERDVRLLPYGDLTLVGERGVGLSGGQRARVSLARAIYREADIYLLDDPLSAVDAGVAKLIFEKCCREFLAGKIVILVTHQIQFLRSADKIILMKDGKAGIFAGLDALKTTKLDLVSAISEETIKSKRSKAKRAKKRSTKTPLKGVLGRKPSTTSQVSVGSIPIEIEVVERMDSPAPTEELSSTGSVKCKIYWIYIKAGAGIILGTATLVTNLSSQIFFTANDIWLSKWTDDVAGAQDASSFRDNVLLGLMSGYNPLVAFMGQPIVEYEETEFRQNQQSTVDPHLKTNIAIYSTLIGGLFITSLLRSTLFFRICNNASINLHNMIFYRVLRSPMSLFESNPIGRILNRFSRDLSIIDELLPATAFDLCLNSFTALGVLVTVAYVKPILIIPACVLIAAVVGLRNLYIHTGRDIKRLESVARSPVYSHIQSTVDGIVTIRAFKVEEMFRKKFDAHLNDHSGTWFMFICASRALGVVTDWCCLVYIVLTTIVILAFSKGTPPGSVGVALSSVVILIGLFQWSVRQSAEFESQMTSVERIIEYTELETEAELITDVIPPESWPDQGRIQFQHVTLQYPSAPLPTLEDINIEIKAEEKVGVVGRTGAGKSSLLSCLFRTVEPKGSIIIDGVNIMTLGLETLRKKISIIPQEAVLFAGTIRSNLDPFVEHTDKRIWEALSDVQLKETVEDLSGKLYHEIREGGGNFSVGQRQLVCLGRALLRSNKILVIDEATANVDHKTDLVIQHTIRTKFAKSTTLTIAHRLNTIIDSNRVLVLDAGCVVEFDTPCNLLKNKNSIFSKLVAQTGRNMARKLRAMAEEFQEERTRNLSQIPALTKPPNSRNLETPPIVPANQVSPTSATGAASPTSSASPTSTPNATSSTANPTNQSNPAT